MSHFAKAAKRGVKIGSGARDTGGGDGQAGGGGAE